MSVGRSEGAVGLALRPATVADVPALHAIEVSSFGDPWSEASFRSMLAQPQVLATVAERGTEVVGYSLAWHLGDEAELVNLAVAPAARGAGIGGALVDALLAELAARGGATVYLEVRAANAVAQALYASRGFAVAGRRKDYYEKPREDAVVMQRVRPDGARRD